MDSARRRIRIGQVAQSMKVDILPRSPEDAIQVSSEWLLRVLVTECAVKDALGLDLDANGVELIRATERIRDRR